MKTIRFFRLIFILTIGYLLILSDINNVFAIGSALILSYSPELLKRTWKLYIPTSWHIFGVVFLFCSQWLGTYLRAYDVIGWWDLMLHAVSAVLVALMVLIVILKLDNEHLLFKNKKYELIGFFVFLGSAASAALWEIWEYIGDTFFGTNAQLGSLTDTMEDIIICVMVGVIFSVFLSYSLKTSRNNFLKKQINTFFKMNH